MITAAHQTMLAPPALPYDAEVEYLGFSGAQNVDTGIIPDANTDAEIDLMFSNTSSGYTFLGGGDAWVTNEFIITQNPSSGGGAGRVYFNVGTLNPGTPAMVYYQGSNSLSGQRHTWGLINKTGYLDGTAVGTWTTLPISTQHPIFIGSYDRSGVAGEFLVGRVWSAKIWQSSVLVRDYVPVRVGSGSSAVGYLFDRVSGTLFGNAGTGAFTIGSDK